MKFPSRILLLLMCGFGMPASAHPVAQGSMEVHITRAEVTVKARVSVEEIFVESSLARSERNATTLEQLWPEHGKYLLGHLYLSADGTDLRGEATNIETPAVAGADQFVIYELRYILPPGGEAPQHLVIRENLLNEFMFAPGNAWEATFVTRVQQEEQPAHEALLLSCKQPIDFVCDWGHPGATGAAGAGIDRRRLAADYTWYGIMHILEGWDHLLFMAALVLAAVTLGDLIKVVTAFTVAHTITLTVSVLNIVRLSPRIVEPMIALSIVFVAVQNVFWPKRTRGWSRLAVAFGFGLFHGLGFAGGLLEAMQGLPSIAIGVAIVAFSLGVELGHQSIVLPVFFGLRLAERTRHEETARHQIQLMAMRGGSALISFAGGFYLMAALRG